MTIEVKLADGVTDEVEGESWYVDDNGTLTVFDEDEESLASYAGGEWKSIKREFGDDEEYEDEDEEGEGGEGD